MKIAFVLSHVFGSLQWKWFSEGLRERGIPHIFVIISESEPTLLLEQLRQAGATTHFLPHRTARSHGANLARVIWQLRKDGVTVVHTELPHGNLIGQAAAVLSGIGARVSTCSNVTWADDYRSRKQFLIDRFTYRTARRIVAQTELSAEFIQRRHGVPAAKIETIWHGLRLSEYENLAPARLESLREKLGLSPDHFVIGKLARFEEWKGHADAVNAFATVAPSCPRARLYLFGRGPTSGDVQNLISRLGLEERVLIKDFVPDATALYRLLDVQLHVPINAMVESFGLTLIEGMASGCAQVVTRSGVAYFTAKHLSNALVVDYRNPPQIAESLLRLEADGELRARLGSSARQTAATCFSYDQKIEKHLDLYRLLLGRRS